MNDRNTEMEQIQFLSEVPSENVVESFVAAFSVITSRSISSAVHVGAGFNSVNQSKSESFAFPFFWPFPSPPVFPADQRRGTLTATDWSRYRHVHRPFLEPIFVQYGSSLILPSLDPLPNSLPFRRWTLMSDTLCHHEYSIHFPVLSVNDERFLRGKVSMRRVGEKGPSLLDWFP